MKKSQAIHQKIIDLTALMHKISVWRFKNKKIVFTNGCFDVLHHGHVHLLAKASDIEESCVVIVGLNSDNSVRQLKGEGRPVNHFDDRALLVANLYTVDAVISFDEPTPINLISTIEPDYLVKGGDYTEDQIVGADIVKAKGGHVVIVPYLENYSTTGLISKLAH